MARKREKPMFIDIWGDGEDSLDDIPEGCRACGGDYPMCKDSCPLFDD